MSRATCLRLFIPLVLKMFNRVLYLDPNLLVLSDARGLLTAGLGGRAVGAVRDLVGERYCKNRRVKASWTGKNTGDPNPRRRWDWLADLL